MTFRAIRRALAIAAIATAVTAPLAFAQEADLLVLKSGPAEAPAGSDVSYSITVSNLGPDAATGFTLTDPIPAGMTFVSAAPGGCTTPSGIITCSIAGLAVGASVNFTFVLHIPGATPLGTTFVNIATAKFGAGSEAATDPNSENDSGVVGTSTPPPPQADMVVSKSGPDAAGPDSDVAFTLTITNAGPAAAASVTLQDTLPGTMTFVSLTQDSGPVMSCTTPGVGSGGTVTCTAASFAAGATATFTLTAHVPTGTASETIFTNIAAVSATTADPTAENNAAAAALTVPSVNADVGVTKSGSVGGAVGASVTYTIVVTNNGPDAASGVVVTDVLPAGSTLISASSTQGACAGTSTVTCTVGTLSPGGSATITLVVTVLSPGGPVSNTATVASTTNDPNPANNSSTATITIASAIPTLSPLTFALLGITLVVVGFFALRVRSPWGHERS